MNSAPQVGALAEGLRTVADSALSLRDRLEVTRTLAGWPVVEARQLGDFVEVAAVVAAAAVVVAATAGDRFAVVECDFVVAALAGIAAAAAEADGITSVAADMGLEVGVGRALAAVGCCTWPLSGGGIGI